MNKQDHKKSFSKLTESGKASVAGIIGMVIALALIVGAAVVQSNAAPAGTIEADVPPITAADHTRGDVNAPVKVIEYSDLECPYCKDFHTTMLQIYSEYGVTNKITWVYRHFPLSQIHKKARGEAIAVECAAKVAGPAKGNEVFWLMIDEIFRTTTSNDGFNEGTLPAVAEKAGANKLEFIKCYNTAETGNKVDSDAQGGAVAGVEGTPYTFVISPKGHIFPLNGAQPIEEVRAIIDRALADK